MHLKLAHTASLALVKPLRLETLAGDGGDLGLSLQQLGLVLLGAELAQDGDGHVHVHAPPQLGDQRLRHLRARSLLAWPRVELGLVYVRVGYVSTPDCGQGQG
jgi:hypothetical protein